MNLLSKLLKTASVTVFVFIVLLAGSCADDHFTLNPKYRLQFSTDTLSFDTVFTTVGSATSKLLIYNRNNVALKISQISLAGRASSYFKINVDGAKDVNNSFSNIEIRPNDSLYVFVSVNIDQQQQNSAVFIQDSLVCVTNGNVQCVQLQAYGQDVEILKGKNLIENTILTGDKPYVIVDSLTVAQNVNLILQPGTKLYFHNNANLFVYGNLIAKGTFEQPIIMRGDRLDKIQFSTAVPYNYVAGQWGGVYLFGNKGNHFFEHVNMNSGYVGIFASNTDRANLSNIEIKNCRIHNFQLYGLVVQNANVDVVNTEISNTSSYTLYLNGGKHSFIHCTVANYFNGSNVQPTSRDKKPAVMIMNLNRVAPMETTFRNCIISGSSESEFGLATRYEELYPGVFNNCYIKVPKPLALPQFSNVGICWSGKKDTLFKSVSFNYEKKIFFNFMPDSVSPARSKADLSVAAQYPIDLNGNNRILQGKPDIGAYQWQPIQKP